MLLTRFDAAALVPVLQGRQLLLVHVERASDILQVLALKREFPRLRLVLVGATEGWTVADRIAAARVPVIANALNDLPATFEQLAATQSNVGRMRAAGVTVALGMINDDEARQVRLARQQAGNLVAVGRVPGASGLSWGEALAAITSGPAEAVGLGGEIGSLRPGRRADVVIWDGDPLENGSAAEIGPDRRRPAAARQPPDQASRPLPDGDRRRAAEGLREVIATVSLALATLAFVGTHLAMSHPLRTRLVQNLGEQWFAAALFGGRLRHPGLDDPRLPGGRRTAVLLWVAPDWAWPVAAGVMLLACILLVGSFFRNPAFPHPGRQAEGGRARRAGCSR